MIDIPTLSLAAGLGNLAFAALTAVYAWSAYSTNHSLTIWRWARVISGSAFLLIWLRPITPLWLSLTVSHLLLIVGWSLECAAYANLLGRVVWQQPLLLLTGLALIVQLALHGLNLSRRFDLIYFSLISGAFFTAMTVLLLTQRPNDLLLRLMGVTNAIMAAIFIPRSIPLFWSSDIAQPSYQGSNLTLWVAGYLITTLNGYGFLLLAKQNDDRNLRAALADVEQAQRQLLSLASHEFRTPAAMIQASLDSLKYLATDIPPTVATRLDNMRQATQRLIDLANVLITQDRLRDLRFGLARRDVEINTRSLAKSQTVTPPELHGRSWSMNSIWRLTRSC